MRVLLLEPDQTLAGIYRATLEHRGHEVSWQRGAGDAVHALDEQSADMIIVELQLPGHNGLEFLYELRSYADWQSVPVIIHSFVEPAKLQQAMTYDELNITDCLYKPQTTLQQLVDAVNIAVPA